MSTQKDNYGDMPHVPNAVSRYMAHLAKKANHKMRGTAMAKRRGRRAARARWSKK